MNEHNWIYEYYNEIKNGTRTVGKYILRLYEDLYSGIEEGRYIFDIEKANKAIHWIETRCFHTEGPLAPGPFNLETWQKALISAMFGIVDEEGKRQFREVILIVARKNGKSLLASAICKYLFYNGGYGTRIFCLAPKLEQADIIYNSTWQMITLDKEWQDLKAKIEGSKNSHNRNTEDDSMLAKHRMTDLYIPGTNSSVKKIAFSAKKSDGFNPSLTICDEIASWQGDQGLKQYEVMKSGMGARDMGDEPGILLSCSTAGYINDSIYDELLKRATRFLNGDSKEKRLLPFLYMIDDVEKWNDINELRKSNPNLGVSVSVDYLLEEIAVAEGSLSKKAEFITKYCNIKQNSSVAWLPSQIVDSACGEPLLMEDFRNCYCVGGIDLSQTRDLTACCVVVEKNGDLNVFMKFFLPREKIDEAIERDGVPYNAYIARGILQPSGDNFVDYHDCLNWFADLVRKYKLLPLKVGYDRYSAQYLVQEMKAMGFHMDDVFQGENLWSVIQVTQGWLEDKRIRIGDNDLLKMHLLNSAVKMSVERGRGKLVKLSPSLHIDGAAALLDAMTMREKYYGEIGEQLKNIRG